MKRVLQFWFTAILFLLIANTHSFAQLSVGDIAFTAFQADNSGGGFNGDAFEFVLLVPVASGTTIYFTDNGYQTDVSKFRTNENLVRWVAQANLPAGTVKTFLAPGGTGAASTAEWTGINTTTGAALATAAFGLAGGGDNISSLINPTFGGLESLSGTAIACITFGGATFSATHTTGSGNSTTALPPGLTDGVNAVSLAATDNGRYNDAAVGSVESGTKAVVGTSINTDSYWTTSGTPLSPHNTTATFTITSTVNLSLSANSGSEAATTVITVTATASVAVTGNQTVSLGVSGTGITAGDYTLSNVTITILDGQTTGSVTFTIVNDADIEGTETATLTISSPSAGITLGATTTQDITITDNDAAPSTTIDLSTYVRIGRYNLPVPLRATAPMGNQLALEVSAVTYNPGNGNLYVLGDEGTSIVEVGKNGQLISTMTLTAGDFADPEGLTHFSGNQFVLVEERERQANLFSYVAGGTLSRADVQSVKLGTTIGNIGLEGISYDPQTGGYILVKETTPQGIFQTDIDFGAGTATNGSPSTVNSTNLFDPALAGLTDIGDVYALSNLPNPLTDDNLLVLSQEDGKVINIGRTGIIANFLTIATDPGNPLNVAGQGHEGVAMDNTGLLYIVNEQGGGDVNHPQLWVYAPASYVYTNAAPVEVSIANPPASLPENTSTASRVKVGNIIVSDDALGTNVLSLTGADAAAFEIDGNELFLKAGTVLDFETKPSYSVTINVDDASVGVSPDASRAFTLTISDVFDNPSPLCITEVAPWSSGNSPGVGADWFEVTNTSAAAVDITGWKIDDDSGSFALASALSGVTSIAAGQSVIFVDGDATKITAFINVWFGGTLPSGVLIGNYGGPGLGAGGDAVNLFDASGNLITGVTFGASPSASPFATFNNAACNANVSALSVVGTNGAFSVVDGANTLIGSPGSIACTAPTATISGGGNVCTPATTTTVTISGTPNAVVVLSNSTMVTIEGDGSTDISLGAGTYTISSVTSAAPASCPGTGNGSATVVINQSPDAPQVNNISICGSGSTNIVVNSVSQAPVSNTFIWNFESGITGTGTSQSTSVAANAPIQTAGAGITASAQGAGSGCTNAITSSGYDIANTSLADAVADNEYFEFCVGTATSPYNFSGVTSINWANRASNTGPLMYALVASNNLTTPLLSGSVMPNGTDCEAEGGAITLNTATCYRLYYWAAGSTGGTLRIEEMTITAQFAAPSGNYNFYDEDPALNANATPVATGTSYDPGTSVGTSDEVWVTCVADNGCESPATKVTVTVNAVPTLDIVQPEPACLPTTVDATAVNLGESIAGGTTTYHATANDATNDANPIDPGTLTALSSSRTLFVRYETTGGCFATGQIDVVVTEKPTTPDIANVLACTGESTAITPSAATTSVVSWSFEGNSTAGSSTNTNLASAGNASRGAGLGDAGFVSGCNSTSTAFSSNNWTAATENEAISGNDYFEFPITTTAPTRLTAFSFFERASGSGPISWALYVNGTKYATGTTSDPCMQESRELDVAICGTTGSIRIYAWRETSGGGTTGTWRVDEVTATLEPAVLYNFYSDNTLTTKLAGPVASYTPPGVSIGNPVTVYVTAVSACAACESDADAVTVSVADCKVDISDPCVCQNNAPVITNGTYSNAGTFKDLVIVRSPSGMTWTVKTVSGLYNAADGTDAVEVGDVLVETSPGVFQLPGYHVDSLGYSITVANGRGTELSSGNTCYYPDPIFAGLPLLIAPTAAPFNVTGTVANGAGGVGTFSLNGVLQAGASAAPTVLTINPATLPVGDNTLTYSFNAGTASSKNLSDPGCVKTVRQTFRVAQCGCQDLAVSLDANCQFKLTASVISDGNCNGATVRVMDNDPSNGDTIDCAGVWTYGMFDAFGNIICWGKVTAEDKTPPTFVCADWFKGTLDCYDVDFVLNNRLTIGNVDATSSPRPAATSTQMINNAEGVAGTGACNLVPPNLVADNINNLGYTYFNDNCRTCGCRTNVRWSDQVVFYNCEQMKGNGGIYARIYRTWVATDCKGMTRDTVQEIPFARPAIKEFGYNGQGDGGKYDYVAELSSCVPDKELIQKSDYMPFVCSYFNRTVAPRNSRCLYLDEVECNYSVSFKDNEFPICGGKGLKIDRELYVFDWCAGGIVDTFHILIKIGDFEGPKCEYAHGAPYDISTGPMDCTAAIPVTVTGLKAAFGISITDNCSLGNVSVSVYTKDRYVKGILVATGSEDPLCTPVAREGAELRGGNESYRLGTCNKEDICWDKVDYAVMNGMMIGLPVGKHLMVIDAFDGCYNASTCCFIFEVKDKIAPVMKCDDDLNVTLSNANGYTNGYAQVSADDIDEGSWDNCKMAWIAVRRNVPDGCAASFIAKGYDTNGNGKLDALPADGDWTKADGFDRNGDGDLADFGETFVLKGGKLMTPLQDNVEFFCCDLAERVTVELWGADNADDPKTAADETNYNFCWMDLLIEDKVAPTCLAPWDVTIYCDDKNIAQIDSKLASAKIFGDVSIPSGNDCAALDTVYSTEKKLKCGAGYIDRIWTLTKQTAKGPLSVTCTQRVTILPLHEYNICFPKDVTTDCKTPIIDTVLTDELGCDILAVNVTNKRYDASDDECYKIFRTYTVINWCTYDDRCGDPMAEGSVYVVDRSLFEGNYGKDPLYVLVRDNDRDGNEEFYLSKNLVPNERLSSDRKSGDYHLIGDKDRDNELTDKDGYNSTLLPTNSYVPYCSTSKEYYHSFMYTQIIKVKDESLPVVTGVRDTFCTSPTACTANITKVVTLKDNCTDKVELETQFLMIAPFQTLEAGKMIMYSTPRWSTKDLGKGQFEIKVSNLPEGTHDLIVVGRDECGNLSLPTRIPFVVKDCKAPAPICINGLSVDLMPDGNGGGMMTVWASDFVASKIYDCNGQGPETKDGLKLITKYSVNRVKQPVDPNQTSISVNCADLELGFILVELHAWDGVGNHDFCVTFIEVQDNRKVCPAPVDKVKIAGTITTEGAGNLQGVSVTLSGSGTQSDMTGTDGNYEFVNISKGGDFTVTPQLDKNHLNGVSTFDLVLIQKHILGVQALNSPYKLIAADANNSKSISTLDMIQIRKLILNIDTHFANNTSWRFVDATYRFPNATNPWSTSFPEVVSVNDLVGNIKANFVAIKVGDVNASASVNGAASAEIRTSEDFKLKTQEQNLKVGNEYKVTFTAEDLKNIQGYQFALNLDQSKVELMDIEYGVAKAENFGVFKNEGLITTSWNSKYEAGALFTLVLRAKADAKLSSTLSLNRTVSPEAYDRNNENLGIALNFAGIQAGEAYELRQNTPNPFSDETVIGFTLPKALKGTLTVRDVKGALVYKVDGNYAKGNNQVTLKKSQLGASGVLYYTLETTDFTATKKMVILE